LLNVNDIFIAVILTLQQILLILMVRYLSRKQSREARQVSYAADVKGFLQLSSRGIYNQRQVNFQKINMYPCFSMKANIGIDYISYTVIQSNI